MPRQTRTDRAGSATRAASGGVETVRSFVSVLAHASRSNDLLPALHEHALEVTGGSCGILFQHNPRNGMLHATSGYGLDALRAEAWTPDESESSLVDGTFATRSAGAHDTAAPV